VRSIDLQSWKSATLVPWAALAAASAALVFASSDKGGSLANDSVATPTPIKAMRLWRIENLRNQWGAAAVTGVSGGGGLRCAAILPSRTASCQ
jgi:hypothetical protein